MTRRPNLFIVGAPKAGTTSLHEYLRGHPDVFMSALKEPQYFAPDVYQSARSKFRYGRDEERYLNLFEGAHEQKRVGESSTHYMSSPMAPKLIVEFEPKARIVCILRNPVEMVYAWHAERVHKGIEDVANFERAFADPAKRNDYIQVACYGTQLKRWFDRFGQDLTHVIVFDDFVADTSLEFAKVLRFLDVEDGYRPEAFDVHNAHSSKSRLAPLLRTAPLRSAGRVVKSIVGHDAAARVSRGLRQARLFQFGTTRAPLSAATRRELEDVFREEVRLAGSLIGRDLEGAWFG